MKVMLRRGPQPFPNVQLNDDFQTGPDFTVINAGEYFADPNTEDVTSKTSVAVNFSEQEMVILGT